MPSYAGLKASVAVQYKIVMENLANQHQFTKYISQLNTENEAKAFAKILSIKFYSE